MPLMRDVIVGFLGFSRASPLAVVPLVPLEAGFRGVVVVSDCECNDEAVEAEGDAVGFAVEAWGLGLAGVAMRATGADEGARAVGLGLGCENQTRGSL